MPDPYLLLWRFHEGAFEGQRSSSGTAALSIHSGSTSTLASNSEGTQVIYTADPQGYGQVFAVDVPAWETLPDLADVKAR